MSQTGRSEIEARLPIRESADHFGPATDFLHDAFQRVVGADLSPMACWKCIVGQRLIDASSISSAARGKRWRRSSAITASAFS